MTTKPEAVLISGADIDAPQSPPAAPSEPGLDESNAFDRAAQQTASLLEQGQAHLDRGRVGDDDDDDVEENEDEDGVFNALCLAYEHGEAMVASEFVQALAGGENQEFEGVTDARLALLLTLVANHGGEFITAERVIQAAEEIELGDLSVEAREVTSYVATEGLPADVEVTPGDPDDALNAALDEAIEEEDASGKPSSHPKTPDAGKTS